jgi:membrane glycosyltransferase
VKADPHAPLLPLQPATHVNEHTLANA